MRFVVAGGLLLATAGCRSQWYRPCFTAPQPAATSSPLQQFPLLRQTLYGTPESISLASSTVCLSNNPRQALTLAEAAYARGDLQQQDGTATCVDSFFDASLQSWRYLEWSTTSCQYDPKLGRAWQLYHSSLGRLIETAQQYRRLDPLGGLAVHTPSGMMRIPVSLHGFVWGPCDFNHLTVVGDYASRKLPRRYQQQGIGVPLVVTRYRQCEERFHDHRQRFAATAILRGSCGTSDQPKPTLELYAPRNRCQVALGSNRVPLKTDLTAPFALAMSKQKLNDVREFLQPGSSLDEAKLVLLEPYQPGKIPLIFIHGLLSDPLTWATLVNEVRSNPALADRYQIWAFQYPTGEPFLRSAATLRQELQAAIDTFDPSHQDPAMSQMVLVGHSMGGLIAKLQVTYSGNLVWRSSSNRPLDEIVTTTERREELRRMFFFTPQPAIKEVVFLGVPHRGSSVATRSLGRLGSRLVRFSAARKTEHDELVEDNPDTFSPQVSKRIPTSVDLLEPSSEILQSMQRLPWNPETKLHSIIGTGQPMLLGGAADGIVPVSSARHGGVVSEQFIDTIHTGLPKHRSTAQELICILFQHLAAFDHQIVLVPQ